MSQQGDRPTGTSAQEDAWWAQLYDEVAEDTGPAPAEDSLDDRFASASGTLGGVPHQPTAPPDDPVPELPRAWRERPPAAGESADGPSREAGGDSGTSSEGSGGAPGGADASSPEAAGDRAATAGEIRDEPVRDPLDGAADSAPVLPGQGSPGVPGAAAQAAPPRSTPEVPAGRPSAGAPWTGADAPREAAGSRAEADPARSGEVPASSRPSGSDGSDQSRPGRNPGPVRVAGTEAPDAPSDAPRAEAGPVRLRPGDVPAPSRQSGTEESDPPGTDRGPAPASDPRTGPRLAPAPRLAPDLIWSASGGDPGEPPGAAAAKPPTTPTPFTDGCPDAETPPPPTPSSDTPPPGPTDGGAAPPASPGAAARAPDPVPEAKEAMAAPEPLAAEPPPAPDRLPSRRWHRRKERPSAPAPTTPAADQRPPREQRPPAGRLPAGRPRPGLVPEPPYVGDGPPTYDAEPAGLPAADPDHLDQLTPDTVLDGGRHGSLTVRAVSLRGDSARFRGEPRRDALLTARFGTGQDAVVLLAVATGSRTGTGTHRAATEACRWIARAVGRSHPRLAGDLRDGRRAELASGLHRLTDHALGRLRARAAELGVEPEAYTASLRCLLLPADPARTTRVFFGVGDGGLHRLRDGAWQDLDPYPRAEERGGAPRPEAEGGERITMDLGIAVPPGPWEPAVEPVREPFRFRASVARPGDVLLLSTAGLAAPLREEPAFAERLRARWGEGAPPGLDGFLADARLRVKGYADDRTAAAVWEA
ncbi:protein phosphatase 2C domain-containing protein [Streptomyces sp. NPDC058374]|uniref:protein phosphatase 2C domain-containing protein n=1 Tax=Streptomyces sp. NPDC058374 TaxID=3346466 RepID=UPI003649650A